MGFWKALHLHEIFRAETKEAAEKQVQTFVKGYSDRYPKAVAKGEKKLLIVYDFPAAHWMTIRSTNGIESAFATVKLRQRVTRGAGTRSRGLTMAYPLLAMAEKSWREIRSLYTGPKPAGWNESARRKSRQS